jgi:hypothetical protein
MTSFARFPGGFASGEEPKDFQLALGETGE